MRLTVFAHYICILPSLFLSPINAVQATPAQYIYNKESASSRKKIGRCMVTSWDGFDADGMSSYPWVSYIECAPGAQFTEAGVATKGFFQIWNQIGTLTVNGESLVHMGESAWVAPGANVTIALSADIESHAAAYVVGSKFVLDASAQPQIFTSSWAGRPVRFKRLLDAVNGIGNNDIKDDGAICNGTSNSRDFVFGSEQDTDPASVTVVNCAPGSSTETNFVWSHFHPYGAVYLPFSGEICFVSDYEICAGPGTARWTSPNLQYYEYFKHINETNIEADSVRHIANRTDDNCLYPIIFAVTNFDVQEAGMPNFSDWPEDAHTNSLAAGIGPWGVFKRMSIRATSVIVKSVEVNNSPTETLEDWRASSVGSALRREFFAT